ncbi:hypothetical protein [Nitrincola nitratireducens]|uniref:Uncharacterized protein n=1 Tax=Nitrincola nitratireducens TaxID=1229521 RepID=W9USL7_9GAMM|nr:hypothetical protein [Nitrincola nitratireducens]EXJ10223.1 hypothetical protein D791_02781 [Nitrincola nitratireducens]
MSKSLADLLDRVRLKYVEAVEVQGHHQPYLTAHHIAHQMLMADPQRMAEMISQDPKILAARPSGLIEDPTEMDNPSVGAIVYSNVVAATLEGLLAVAVNRGWLDVDDQGQFMVDAAELDSVKPVSYTDFSSAKPNLAHQQSELGRIFMAAEQDYTEKLNSEPHNAYQLAVQIASDYSVFSPEDLAPLILENPLLLGLRIDDRIDEEMFGDNPPAGLIVSLHLTDLLLQSLLDIAGSMGALELDSAGEMIIPFDEEDRPIVH